MTHPTTITAQPGVPFVDIVREFDAPAEALFRAHTDPALFVQWTGPHGMTVQNVILEPRTGGRWSYEFRGEGDAMFGFSGVFHTVEPTTIIQTAEFSLAPRQVALASITFHEEGGRTRLESHEVYPSVEARDMAVASGMERGIVEGYERLDEVVARPLAGSDRRG